MSGSMSMADLAADLKASLNDAGNVFKGTPASGEGEGAIAADPLADFKRHITVAAADFGRRKRARTQFGSVTLVAGQADYPLPTGYAGFKSSLWGIQPIAAPKPWEIGYPGRLPSVTESEVEGTARLVLDPPPSEAQIAALGATYSFYYYAAHTVHASDGSLTTIKAVERHVLLLRAQAEAMRELAARNIVKPVETRGNFGSQPRNGTPAHLYGELLREFEAA